VAATLGVEAKIERAKKHISELESRCAAFFDSDPRPYVVATKRNPQTRQLIYYLDRIADTPIDLAVITGDVIQCLRSALDHLAYQLVRVGSPNAPPESLTYVYFPVGDTPTDYETKKSAQTKGMRKEAVEAIDAVKPYMGGNDTLWRIHRLNRIDKHRLLVTLVSQFYGFDVGAYMQTDMRKAFGGEVHSLPQASAYLRPANRGALKTGDELLVDAADAEVNTEMDFRFTVAISEPGIIENEPLLEALHQMADLVTNLIPIFRPLIL
jgi:hypothetical protein